MILAKKVRIYPTKEQEQKLWQSVGTARFIYNYTLAKQEENYKNGGKFINDGVIRKELTQLKKSELTWLNEVSNNITKQSVKDACKAYKRFFKSLANKPKFKSRKKSKPSFYNDPIKLKVKEKKVLIEKVGWIKINEQIPINVKYNNEKDNKFPIFIIGNLFLITSSLFLIKTSAKYLEYLKLINLMRLDLRRFNKKISEETLRKLLG